MAFDPQGNLYATEVMDGRVSVRDADGRTRVLRDDLPSANGITVHQGRLFIGECREGGRLLELDLHGGEPRVLLENVPSPNAMEVGPDGLLYFPVMGANEIWRIDPDGGEPERVAGDLGVPDAVKFDADGYIVSTQVHSGQVLRIDPRTGEQTVLANLNPGLDNLTFVDDRLFVSNFTGEITEILADGTTRTVLPGGLNWPLDLAVGADGEPLRRRRDLLLRAGPDDTLQHRRHAVHPGLSGLPARGGRDGTRASSSSRRPAARSPRYRPAQQRKRSIGRRFRSALRRGDRTRRSVAVAELGAGRVLGIRGGRVEVFASGLNEPVGVAIAPDGGCAGVRGRRRSGGQAGPHPAPQTGGGRFGVPQGILVLDGICTWSMPAQRTLIAFDLDSGTRAPSRRSCRSAQRPVWFPSR